MASLPNPRGGRSELGRFAASAQFLPVWSSRSDVDTVARRLALGRSKAYKLVRRAGILRSLDGALRVEEAELTAWLRTTRQFPAVPATLRLPASPPGVSLKA